MVLNENLKVKLNRLISLLNGKKVIIAFSGGVDSSLLGFLSYKYAQGTLLVTEQSVLYPREEIEATKEFSKKFEIPHIIIERNPLEDVQFCINPKDRCYICKTGLYNEILKIKEEKEYDLVLDGSNYDDLNDYRPGIKALEDLNIMTPYLLSKVSKQEIRDLCEHFNLEVKSKPSMACFSSRIPYGQEISKEKLNRIREAERFLKEHFHFKQLRVRHHENGLARIELLPKDLDRILDSKMFDKIVKKFKIIGFKYVTLDIEGFRSGSMNEILDKP
ncbi:MAG: ATP-dependent sacrificial sulfur transferase LarE [Promethearchaeota archaeon]